MPVRVRAITERRLVAACAGAIALHALDAAFVHPQPGTAATDHLVSGLVPVVVLAAFAVAANRVRAGLGVALELIVGLAALVGAIAVAGRHVALAGLGGADLTGLLMGLAGATLIGLALTRLWRTRRLDDPPLRRYGRRALLAAGALVVGIEVVVPLCVAVVATHRARVPQDPPALGARAENIHFTAGDGTRLAGSYVPSRNGAAIIVAPGRAAGPAAHARMLVRHGYGVLLFDRRGEGASGGDFNAYGWSSEPDLRAAVAFLKARRDVAGGRIGGLGLSVGGETLLQAAAHDRGVRAVVSEGAGERSVAETRHLSDTAARWQMVPAMAIATAAVAVLGDDLPPADLAGLVARIAPRPVFFIYAARGQEGEKDLNPYYYRRAGRPKALWEVPGSAHTRALKAHPRAYERRVVAFFDRALGVARNPEPRP